MTQYDLVFILTLVCVYIYTKIHIYKYIIYIIYTYARSGCLLFRLWNLWVGFHWLGLPFVGLRA